MDISIIFVTYSIVEYLKLKVTRRVTTLQVQSLTPDSRKSLTLLLGVYEMSIKLTWDLKTVCFA